jgi:hypothetical protein
LSPTPDAPDPAAVELDDDEWAAAVEATLARLGYTRAQLAAMAASGDLLDPVARTAWRLVRDLPGPDGASPQAPEDGDADETMAAAWLELIRDPDMGTGTVTARVADVLAYYLHPEWRLESTPWGALTPQQRAEAAARHWPLAQAIVAEIGRTTTEPAPADPQDRRCRYCGHDITLLTADRRWVRPHRTGDLSWVACQARTGGRDHVPTEPGLTPEEARWWRDWLAGGGQQATVDAELLERMLHGARDGGGRD